MPWALSDIDEAVTKDQRQFGTECSSDVTTLPQGDCVVFEVVGMKCSAQVSILRN